jgi:uncharacterized protein (DUF427 family)
MPERTEPGPNQESVWDYPRPPALEPCDRRVRVVVGDVVIADTTDAKRVLETSHPPVYYLPPADVRTDLLSRSGRTSMCEFKGRAFYYTLSAGERTVENVAWAYPDPVDRYEALTDHFAFYLSRIDAGYVGDEEARAQEGDFYGGWITDDVVGPFKGAPGTLGW